MKLSNFGRLCFLKFLEQNIIITENFNEKDMSMKRWLWFTKKEKPPKRKRFISDREIQEFFKVMNTSR